MGRNQSCGAVKPGRYGLRLILPIQALIILAGCSGTPVPVPDEIPVSDEMLVTEEVSERPFVGMYDEVISVVDYNPGPAFLEIDGRCPYIVQNGKWYFLTMPTANTRYDPESGVLSLGRRSLTFRSGDLVELRGQTPRLLRYDFSDVDEYEAYVQEWRSQYSPCTRMVGVSGADLSASNTVEGWRWVSDYWEDPFIGAQPRRIQSDVVRPGLLRIVEQCAYAVIDERRYLVLFPRYYVDYDAGWGLLVAESGDFVESGDEVIFRGELVLSDLPPQYAPCEADGTLAGHVASASGR